MTLSRLVSPFRFVVKWTLVRPYFALRASYPVWFGLNWRAVSAFRKHHVPLSEIAARIVRDMERDGIAIAHIDELFPNSDVLLRMQEETKRRLPHATMSDKKEFFLDMYSSHPTLDFADPFVQFSLDERIVNIANAYLKMWVKFYRYRLTGTVIVPPGKDPRFSQCWHRDPEDKKLCKIFVYLNDVDETTGPFMYVAGSHHGGKWRGVYSQQTPYGNYPPDDVVAALPREYVRVCTGRAGTIIFADTSGIHRGGFSTARQRLMFIAAFSSSRPFGKRIAFDLPNDRVSLAALPEHIQFALSYEKNSR